MARPHAARRHRLLAWLPAVWQPRERAMPWTVQAVSATYMDLSVADYTGFLWATAALRRRLEHRRVMETVGARSRGNREIRRRPMGRTLSITAMTGRWGRVVGVVLLVVGPRSRQSCRATPA